MKSGLRGLLPQITLCLSLAVAELGCGGSSPVTVTISPTSAAAGVGENLPFTATTSNQSQVNWSVTCSTPPCGSFSSTSTASGVPTTYTAPSIAQSNSVSITITAAASSSASAQANVTLPPYQVSVSSDVSQVNPGTLAHFTAQAVSGPANAMFRWTLSCSSSPCGSLSQITTQSGVVTTYTAPASPPLAGLTVTFTATSTANSSISAFGTIQVLGVQVSVVPSNANVEATRTQQFTATVTNDPTNSGVTWSVSCTPAPCGSMPPGPTPSGTPNTYTAPPSPPAALTVTVTATSVAYNGATATASVTVPAITVSVSPGSALIPLNSSLQFIATIANDPGNAGVNWTLIQGSSVCSTCGSVSLSSTPSGNPTTYTPPAALPANPIFTLTATSATDNTKSANATINLSTGTVQLVPQSWNFGYRIINVASSPEPFTLTNTGATALNITGITVTGTDPHDFSQTDTCGSSVGPAASCSISVVFKPIQRGTRNATVSIADSSSDSPQQISVTGTGITRRGFGVGAVRSALSGSMIAAAPVPVGSEPVGTSIFDWIDTSRSDPFLNHGASRELLVRLWYPASLTQPCEPAEYTSPRVWSLFSRLFGVPLPRVTTNSCMNAAVASGVHPVVVFTHGYTGTFTDYTFLFEDLASRGYIVASVNHTYEATATDFPDGRFVKSLLGSYIDNTWRADDKTLVFASSVRLQDLKFVVNQLEGLNRRAGNPFAHKLDLSRLAIVGHSAGGTIAFRALNQDARFKAAVILDGYLSPSDIHPTVAPVLILRAGEESDAADRCLMLNLRGPHLLVNLSGAEHLTLSDALWIARGAIASGPKGPDGTVAGIRDYVASFLDNSLRERPVHPLVTGPSSIYPDAAVSERDQSCSQP